MSHLITNQSCASEFLMSFNTNCVHFIYFQCIFHFIRILEIKHPVFTRNTAAHFHICFNRLWLMMLLSRQRLIKCWLPCKKIPQPIWWLASESDYLLIIMQLYWAAMTMFFCCDLKGSSHPFTSSAICTVWTNLHTTRTVSVYKQWIILD